jgi:hypothetical protein
MIKRCTVSSNPYSFATRCLQRTEADAQFQRRQGWFATTKHSHIKLYYHIRIASSTISLHLGPVVQLASRQTHVLAAFHPMVELAPARLQLEIPTGINGDQHNYRAIFLYIRK